jgi:hypothetical protein
MPQVRCPNCGQTINLANRKGIDVDMIKKAVQKEDKSFTDLLHVTQLPRKTLSLRLKELRGNGTIVKTDGMYRLNGDHSPVYKGASLAQRFSAPFSDKRRLAVFLMVFLIGVPVSAQVFATFFAYHAPQAPPIIQEPTVLGSFTAAIEVQNVNELYTWQCVITFNSSKLKVLDIKSGEFLDADFPLFASAFPDSNTLAFGATLKGDEPGKTGSGTLATVVFGYFEADYEMPEILSSWQYLETYWIDFAGNEHSDPAAFSLSVSGGL